MQIHIVVFDFLARYHMVELIRQWTMEWQCWFMAKMLIWRRVEIAGYIVMSQMGRKCLGYRNVQSRGHLIASHVENQVSCTTMTYKRRYTSIFKLIRFGLKILNLEMKVFKKSRVHWICEQNGLTWLKESCSSYYFNSNFLIRVCN